MSFGWYNEQGLCYGHPSCVSYPVSGAFKFETHLICIVFSDPNPIFSNFDRVPSLEYNAAIFTECYIRIENWNYPTKMYTFIMSLLFLQCAETQCPRRVLPVITFAPSHCKLQHSVRCFVVSGHLPLYPCYTGAATFVPPLCDHKTGQAAVEGRTEAERLPWSFKDGT